MDDTIKAQIDFLKDSLEIMNDTNYKSLRKIALDTIYRMEKQLLIQRVGQQREMLVAFLEMLENTPQVEIPLNVGMNAVDRYLGQ